MMQSVKVNLSVERKSLCAALYTGRHVVLDARGHLKTSDIMCSQTCLVDFGGCVNVSSTTPGITSNIVTRGNGNNLIA